MARRAIPLTALDEMPISLTYRYHTFFGVEKVINLSAPVLPKAGTATVLVTGKPNAHGREQKLLARARELLKARKANARQPESGVVPITDMTSRACPNRCRSRR